MIVNVCPKCGSAKITYIGFKTTLSPNRVASCSSCDWNGKESELLVIETTNIKNVDEGLSIAEEVASDYKRRLAALAAKDIGIALVSSGLIGTNDKVTLSKLIRAAVLGAWKATLEEIEKMQKELGDETK